MKVELLFVKQVSNASIMHSVEGDKLVRELRTLFTATTPLLFSILGNILTMSKDTRIAFSGIALAFSVSDMSFQ